MLASLAAAMLSMSTETTAQEPGAATINTFVYLDLNNDGKFSSGEDSTSLEPTCRVLVLKSDVAVTLESNTLPIVAEAGPDPAGHASLAVPTGEYKVAYHRCAPTPPIRTGYRRPNLQISEYREYEAGCCPHIEGTPDMVVVEAAFAGPLFLAHHVDVGAGETVDLTLRAYPSSSASGKAVWWVLWVGTGAFVLLVVVGYFMARARGRV